MSLRMQYALSCLWCARPMLRNGLGSVTPASLTPDTRWASDASTVAVARTHGIFAAVDRGGEPAHGQAAEGVSASPPT